MLILKTALSPDIAAMASVMEMTLAATARGIVGHVLQLVPTAPAMVLKLAGIAQTVANVLDVLILVALIFIAMIVHVLRAIPGLDFLAIAICVAYRREVFLAVLWVAIFVQPALQMDIGVFLWAEHLTATRAIEKMAKFSLLLQIQTAALGVVALTYKVLLMEVLFIQ